MGTTFTEACDSAADGQRPQSSRIVAGPQSLHKCRIETALDADRSSNARVDYHTVGCPPGECGTRFGQSIDACNWER